MLRDRPIAAGHRITFNMKLKELNSRGITYAPGQVVLALGPLEPKMGTSVPQPQESCTLATIFVLIPLASGDQARSLSPIMNRTGTERWGFKRLTTRAVN